MTPSFPRDGVCGKPGVIQPSKVNWPPPREATTADDRRSSARTSAIFARALRDQGTPIPDIAQKLKIQSGKKNAGKHPSVASLYRALAETDAQHLAARP